MALCRKCLSEKELGKKCRPCKKAYDAARHVALAPKIHAKNEAWRQANLAKDREAKRRYAIANKEHLAARRSEWIDKHPERMKVYNKRWRDANSEKARGIVRAYNRKNPEKVAAGKKRWNEANPEMMRMWNIRRRAKLAQANGSHTVAEWLQIVEKQRSRCADCGVKCRLTKDHVIPLFRGGTDFAYNIVGRCKPCNSRKGTRLEPGSQHSLFDRVA